MKNPIRRLFAALLLLACATNSHAALVANGDYTTDTATGLDWLDLDLSLGLSINQVTAQLGAGGLFDGYQIATTSQLHTFLTNAGWIGPFDPSNTSNVDFVESFKSQTTSFTNDPLDTMGNGFTNDPLDDFSHGFTDAAGTGITTYSITGPIDPNFSDQNTGTYLVRATVVPVPPAFWLFGSGLVLLMGYARQKRIT